MVSCLLQLLQYVIVFLMMDTGSVRNMYSDLAVTNKQYCQSCILLVLYIIWTYDARKLKHKIYQATMVDQRILVRFKEGRVFLQR